MLIKKEADRKGITNDEDRGYFEIARLLIAERGYNIDCRDTWRFSPLHWAAARGRLETVNLLKDKGADLMALTSDGESTLHLALKGGHIEVVRELIEGGSDIECRDRLHYTPLHNAALHGHVEIVELLAAKGADVNRMTSKSSSKGDTPLDLAAQTNQAKVIEVLLAHGVDPDS